MKSLAQYAGVKTLVLGGGGFIGRHVARTLADMGAAVVAVTRTERPPERGMASAACDLTRSGTLEQLIEVHQPAILFNLAGYGVDPSERDETAATALNSALPPRIAEIVARQPAGSWSGQRIVHAGSALEYGTASGDLVEATRARPTTLYGRTKFDGTRQLHATASALGVNAAIGRLFTVYGQGEHAGRLLPSLLAAAEGSDPIPLTVGEQRRDFTYVTDAVEGLLRLGLCEEARIGPVNIATGRLTTVHTFVETAASVLGISKERLRFGALPTRKEEMAHDPVSVRRMLTLTGWQPAVDIRDGLERARTYRLG